jgi:outer membrane protein OmpA-like peptidoglycan-associated protein
MQSPLENDSILNNGKLLKHKFLSKAHDGPVDFNKEENQMVITKNIIGKKKGKSIVVLALYFSKFDGKKWGDLVPFEYNNTDYNVGHGCFSENGKKIYFTSDMPGGNGGTDIYVSSFENGKWSKPENLGSSINTDKNELFPFVNENTLFFASNGHYGLGGLDLFEASLISKSVNNIGYPVNSSADDFAMMTDITGEFGYFSSNRKNNIDGIYKFDKNDIYLDVIVQVFEKYDINEIVPSHAITLTNKLTGEEEEYFSDANGQLRLRIRQNETYEFSTKKEEFKLKERVELNTKTSTKDTTFECNLFLLPTKITIALKVVSKDTKKALEGATTVIPKFLNGKDTVMVTNKNGLVTITVDRNTSYTALGSKKGFIDDKKSFNTSNEDGKIIELQLELTPIKKGEKFQLDDIFYDLNKSTLRPESAASLDKLADFIIKNGLSIELSSHTDARGSDAYNLKLSQARAQSCVDYLLTKGVNKASMKAKGYGETQLINKCKNGITCLEELHQENRRTEVKILSY